MPFSDPDKARQYKREWAQRRNADPEYVELRRAQKRENYYRNGHKWKSTDPAYLSARSANKQALKLGAAGVLTTADIEALWERQPMCLACGNGRGVDHIRALSRGGANTPDNLQNLCVVCNQIKHTWDLTPDQIKRPPFDGDERICRRGHDRTLHTYTYPGSGRRICGLCHSAAVNRYRARKADAA